MNTADFDLDINHWSVLELEKLFQLPSNFDYNVLLEKKNQLQTTLSYDNNLDLKNRDNLVNFLNKAVNKIVAMNKNNILSEIEQRDLVMRYDDVKNDIYEYNDKFVIKGESSKTPFTASSAQHELHAIQQNKAALINPLSFQNVAYTINVDSGFRANYDNTKSTDYIVELPQPINNVTSMELDMIEIPLTYYAVSETLGNNSFNITIGGNDYLIKLADGNYETTQSDLKKAKLIENEINEALEAQGINNVSYTVDHTSGRSVFSRTDGSSDVSFTLDFVVNPKETALQLTLGWLLGFRTGEINCLNSIASEGICNIRGPRYAFICIDDYQNNVHNNFICPYESSLVNKPIITRINLETETQSQTVYRSGEIRGLTRGVMSKRDYFGPVNLQRFHIQLIDEYGRIIDLNHMDWSLILMFKCIYEY